MKRQLIIKVPDNAVTEEIKCMFDYNTKAYFQGYPIFLLPGWDYDLVEVSEPTFLVCDSSKDDERKRREFVDALFNAKERSIKSE